MISPAVTLKLLTLLQPEASLATKDPAEGGHLIYFKVGMHYGMLINHWMKPSITKVPQGKYPRNTGQRSRPGPTPTFELIGLVLGLHLLLYIRS
jgi:hypothetical protein